MTRTGLIVNIKNIDEVEKEASVHTEAKETVEKTCTVEEIYTIEKIHTEEETKGIRDFSKRSAMSVIRQTVGQLSTLLRNIIECIKNFINILCT